MVDSHEEGRPDGPVRPDQTQDRTTAGHRQVDRQLETANRALKKRVAQRTAQLDSLTRQLTHAEQRERHRLAQQLDDDLRPLLLQARHGIDALGADVERPEGKRRLAQMEDLLDRSLDSLRGFAEQLDPPILRTGAMHEILLRLVESMWQQHRLAVQLDADPRANPQALEVRITLFYAVRELLWNVNRHAGTRNARVTLTLAGPDRLRITVSDRGIGFDPAARLGQGRFRDGQSLFHLRERMEMLGGQMDIHSTPGEGTEIALLVPLRMADASAEQIQVAAVEASAAPAQAVSIATAPAPAPKASAIRVLLADDHGVVRDGLGQLLQRQPDMEVVAKAANGLEAVDLALELRPDVIVMDANMPLLSGVQAARRIMAQLPQTRIIALSMYSIADMDLAMRQAGACDYLTKESAPETLVETIRRHAAGPAGR